MFYWLLKILIAPIVRLIWVKKVEGLENIPKTGSAIIASNHESYFDFICLLAVCPRRIYFLAGEVFFKKWWWYPLVKFTGQIRVDRDQKNKSAAFNKALEILNQGKVLGIFPEGTRSADGKLQRAYSGVAKLALTAQLPVVPAGISGTFKIMSRYDKYPKFKKICQIKIGEPIDLSQYYNQKDNQEILKFITDQIIMKKIAELTGEEYNF